MSNTIAIFASARRNGNTGKFIDWIAEDLGIDVIDLSKKEISPYDYDHKNIGDDFLDKEAARLGVTRQSIIKIWLAERLEQSAYNKNKHADAA